MGGIVGMGMNALAGMGEMNVADKVAGGLEQAAGSLEQAAGSLLSGGGQSSGMPGFVSNGSGGGQGGPQGLEQELSQALQGLAQELQQLSGGLSGLSSGSSGAENAAPAMGSAAPAAGSAAPSTGSAAPAAGNAQNQVNGTIGQLTSDANADNVNGDFNDLSNLQSQVSSAVSSGQMSAAQGNKLQTDIGNMENYENKVMSGDAHQSKSTMQANEKALANQIAEDSSPGSSTGSTSVNMNAEAGHL